MKLNAQQAGLLNSLTRQQLERIIKANGITTYVTFEETKAARADIREMLESGRLAFVDIENVSGRRWQPGRFTYGKCFACGREQDSDNTVCVSCGVNA